MSIPDSEIEFAPSLPKVGDPESNGRKSFSAGWPEPLGKAAFHGVTGDVVRAIEPQTEADPAAILLQFLTAVGVACGRGPGFTVDASRHHLNLYCMIVGESALSRKGTSFNQAIAPVLAADATFSYTTGMSSGEGLIHEVRDPKEDRRRARTKEEKERADDDGFITEVVDEGVQDKRALIAETEFASVIARMGREANTLSPVLRQAWEGGLLRAMTKGTPETATGAHIGCVGHITVAELRKKLPETELLSGFANRYVWACARRSQSLPRGGKTIEWRDSAEVEQIRMALRFAQVIDYEHDFDRRAGELWDREYERFNEEEGLLAAVTNRGSAQTRRIATLYALLDCSTSLKIEHVRAALEVWRFCHDSCAYLFGDQTGDVVMDAILNALRQRGSVTRTEINDTLSRNVPAEKITRALMGLVVGGLAHMEQEPTGGRPLERWYPTRRSS